MLAAEFDRLHVLTELRAAAVNVRAWDTSVVSILQQVGFFSLLELPDPLDPVMTDVVKILPFRAGEMADPEPPGEMMEELEAITVGLEPASQVDFNRLSGALFEGVINTKQHAYVGLAERHAGRWWITGAVHYGTRQISVVIYDQGVTIPTSLPKWRHWERVRDFVSKYAGSSLIGLPGDGASIAAAMAVSRSSTGEAHRGKGLAEMEAFLDTCSAGRLRILSRYGEYVAEPNKKPIYSTHRNQVRGTLVQWTVTV
jgi:hypothetical protein